MTLATTQALEESPTEDENPVSGEDPVSHKLEIMMTILIDLTGRVQATEHQSRKKATTSPVSPSTTWVDQRRAQVCHQPSSSEEPDLSKAVRDRVAKRLRQL